MPLSGKKALESSNGIMNESLMRARTKPMRLVILINTCCFCRCAETFKSQIGHIRLDVERCKTT